MTGIWKSRRAQDFDLVEDRTSEKIDLGYGWPVGFSVLFFLLWWGSEKGKLGRQRKVSRWKVGGGEGII